MQVLEVAVPFVYLLRREIVIVGIGKRSKPMKNLRKKRSDMKGGSLRVKAIDSFVNREGRVGVGVGIHETVPFLG